MLRHNCAYKITPANYKFISTISTLDEQTLKANLGWYAYFSEIPSPHWELIPISAVDENKMDIEMDAWAHA